MKGVDQRGRRAAERRARPVPRKPCKPAAGDSAKRLACSSSPSSGKVQQPNDNRLRGLAEHALSLPNFAPRLKTFFRHAFREPGVYLPGMAIRLWKSQ